MRRCIYVHICRRVCICVYECIDLARTPFIAIKFEALSVFKRCVCVNVCIHMQAVHTYGVAMISRLPQNIGLLCKRALCKRRYSAKETYNFKEPPKRSHPILSNVYTAKCSQVGTGIPEIISKYLILVRSIP